MVTSFKTVATTSKGEIQEKGSKFIAYVFPVCSKQEVKDSIELIKVDHPSARHICYAYRIGVGQEEYYRANDDGEPAGSAGKPIYGQILSFEITNCLIAVVRYFGGTKLGVGGLISAYKETSKQALLVNTIVEKEITKNLKIVFGYGITSAVNSIIHKYNLATVDKSFEATCKLTLAVPIGVFDEVEHTFERVNGLEVK